MTQKRLGPVAVAVAAPQPPLATNAVDCMVAAWPSDLDRVAGVDEVGRGSLFGPVVAAAVVLTDDAAHALMALGVKDSKQLSPLRRESLAVAIQEYALDCKIGLASVREIDRLNILQASLLAMKRAVCRLSPQPKFCLVDGNQSIPHLGIVQQAVVKGDQRECAIASASIIAKVWRDALITRLDRRYPGYDLASNKGYGSLKHRQGLARQGVSPQHRMSFRTCYETAADQGQLLLLPDVAQPPHKR